MFRRIVFISATMACVIAMVMGCNKSSNPVSVTDPDLSAPTGATLLMSEGFEDTLGKWTKDFMILAGAPHYTRMQITADAFKSGTHSLTSDTNFNALCYESPNKLDSIYLFSQNASTIAGVQFYIMAKEAGQANFTVEIGQNAGSSGGLSKAFGIGFDPSDSIKATYTDVNYPDPMKQGHNDSILAPIILNHWYKCCVEVNFATKTITYSLDGAQVRTQPFPTVEMYGIDRVLVFRGYYGGLLYDQPSADGAKKYYVDDIVLYRK